MLRSTMVQLLTVERKAWLKYPDGSSNVIRILPDNDHTGVQCYLLYTAYEAYSECLGRILFDANGFWIYDGDQLTVDQQEQVARLIMGIAEKK
ncbi:hypothetical protein LLH06_04330 [Mucilaginibacter daejeonensis]|uniref:hypothetical protein n=1 Tax=Mucilaginibacter daejeonensis TaxID=398049 RepID=UPI001D177A1F|nr:hypothetical protein [Mucilaginibacter daejeonensis]UEG54196.1 hypothetical protein LLH06_04330 [Mucilaginibacter daejeonensis]